MTQEKTNAGYWPCIWYSKTSKLKQCCLYIDCSIQSLLVTANWKAMVDIHTHTHKGIKTQHGKSIIKLKGGEQKKGRKKTYKNKPKTVNKVAGRTYILTVTLRATQHPRSGAMAEKLPHAQAQGQRPRGATSHPRSEAVAEKSYPTSKVRSSGCALREQP